jgi:O-antigen ligase
VQPAESRPAFAGNRFPLLLGASIGVAAILLRDPVWVVAAAVACLLPLAWFAFSIPRAWLIPFFAALILLPPLPSDAGSSGLHASVVVAAVGLLAGLARAGAWRLRLTLLNAALIAFSMALTLSLAFALLYSGASAAASSAARVILFVLAVYVYFSASQGPDRGSLPHALFTTRILFAIALLAALFGCVDFVFQLPAPAGFSAQFVWLESGVYRRAQGLFYEASTLGNFCAFFLTMSMVCLAQPRGKRVLPRWVAAAGVILFAGTLLISFSRAAVIAAGIGCATLALVERRSWANRRAVLGVGVLALAAMALFSILLPEFAAGYVARLASNGADLFTAPDRTFSGRLETWRTLGGFIANRPWQTALGIGYKTLPNTTYLGKPLIADNMYLSALIETGVFGLSALLLLNAVILRTSWRALRAGSFFGKWMFCFWMGQIVQMFSADILTYWRVLPIYFWVLAQVVKARSELENTSEEIVES